MILDLVMQKKIERKEFLKLAMLSNFALIAKPLESFSESFQKYSIPVSNENVTYFKKGDADYETLR